MAESLLCARTAQRRINRKDTLGGAHETTYCSHTSYRAGRRCASFRAGLIVNEWNAVGENKVFGGGGTDTFFNPNYGAITGNGGNWVELVVTTDHLNIQGWKLDWSNADPDAGSVTFTNNSLWSDLRSGTIITIREDDDGDLGTPVGARPTDASYNPVGNDWWIEINESDTTYVNTAGFKTDNDDWQMRILGRFQRCPTRLCR